MAIWTAALVRISSTSQSGSPQPSRTPIARSAGPSSAIPPTQENDIANDGDKRVSGCGATTANAAAASTADGDRPRPLSCAIEPAVSIVAALTVGRCSPASAEYPHAA